MDDTPSILTKIWTKAHRHARISYQNIYIIKGQMIEMVLMANILSMIDSYPHWLLVSICETFANIYIYILRISAG